MTDTSPYLNPGRADRWVFCPASAYIEEDSIPYMRLSREADIIAHKLCFITVNITKVINYEQNVKEKEKLRKNPSYDRKLHIYAAAAAEFILNEYRKAKDEHPKAKLRINQNIHLNEYAPNSMGTVDAYIITDNAIHVIDFRYENEVKIDCKDNPQMMATSLAVLLAEDLFQSIKTVKMSIYQPRINHISTIKIETQQLRDWGEGTLKQIIKKSKNPKEFNPGEHCQLCIANSRCKYKAKKLTALTRRYTNPKLMNDKDIAKILKQVYEFESWIKDVKEKALKDAMAGIKFNGFKIVEEQTELEYISHTTVMRKLKKAGYPENRISRKIILPINELKTKIGENTAKILLDGLLVRKKGNPILVPKSDPRKIYTTQKTKINPKT